MRRTLTRIAPRSLALALGSCGAAVGIAIGLLALLDAFLPWVGRGFAGSGGLGPRLGLVAAMLAGYTVGGWLIGYLGASAYNAAAARFGGLTWEVSDHQDPDM